MKEENQVSPGANYSIKSSMNFKKGKFALFANIFSLFAIIAGAVALFFLFDYDSSESNFLITTCIHMLIFVLIFVGFLLTNSFIQIIFYKAGGGGKIKLHIGLMIEVYCENPIKRNYYFFAHLFSNIIPLSILILAAVFFWSDYIYYSIVFVASNFLAYFPMFIFILKQDKDSLAKFENGILNIFAKAD